MDKEHFMKFVIKDSETGCWNWNGALTDKGYGLYSRSYLKGVRAHKYAYENLIGAVPEGLQLDHTCRNRICVNPEHLEPVTAATNQRRGLRTKLTPELVKEIRTKIKVGGQIKGLSLQYKVSTVTIYRIINNLLWKDVV